VQRVGGVALGFKPKTILTLSPLTFPVEAKSAIDFRGSWNSRKFNWKSPGRKGSAGGGTFSQCGAWTVGANCLSCDCSELHPALSRLPGGPLLRWRYPNYCHSRPRSRGSVRCRYSDYGMDSLHATIQHSKEGMPSKQPTPLPLHLPLIRGLQTYMC
jgi:hypothetical protein